MTCAIPGMCSRSPECKDKRCEGHPINSLSLHRVSLTDEAQDLQHRPANPEECEGWAKWGMRFLAAITVSCAAMAVWRAVRYVFF